METKSKQLKQEEWKEKEWIKSMKLKQLNEWQKELKSKVFKPEDTEMGVILDDTERNNYWLLQRIKIADY